MRKWAKREGAIKEDSIKKQELKETVKMEEKKIGLGIMGMIAKECQRE